MKKRWLCAHAFAKACFLLPLLLFTAILASCSSEGQSGQPTGHAPESAGTAMSDAASSEHQTTPDSAARPDAAPDSTAQPDAVPGMTAQTDPAPSSTEDAGGSTAAPSVPASDPASAFDFKVSLAEWSDVQWESYSNAYFTLTIPKGWKVEWQGNAQQLYWRVVKPGENLGLSNLDHRYAAKDYRYMQMGGTDLYLVNGTVREFFETVFSNTTEYFTVKNAVVPENKAQLQAIRPSTPIRDYQSLYAVFKENGMEGEGVYSAVVMESRDVWANGMNYGLWEINCIYTEWAPLGQLVNWQPVFSQIAKSFQYTSYYLQEWRNVLGRSSSPEGQNNTGDSVLEAFEERSRADTILQEKRSDMIGEYERVVDNETGDIYRAYDGFLDDLGSDQSRYSEITDDQYADGYVGWIERP